MTDPRPSAPLPTGAVQAAVRAEARRWRRRFLLSGLLAVLSVAALVNYGVFGPVPSPEVPAELMGTWISDDSRYVGRQLEFGSNLVMLGTGEGAGRETYPVYDVRRQAGAGVTRYLITYLIGQDDVTLSVIYRSAGRPSIELVNPKGVVWRRVER